MLKLDSRLINYLKTFEDQNQHSVAIEKACDAASKLKVLVEERSAIMEKLKLLELYDIRTNHTYEAKARYLIQKKFNHSARIAPNSDDLKSPVNLKKFLKKVNINESSQASLEQDDSHKEETTELKILEATVLEANRGHNADESLRTLSPKIPGTTELLHGEYISPVKSNSRSKPRFLLLPVRSNSNT